VRIGKAAGTMFGRAHRARGRAQALVELALVMPLLVGIITVLFQFGILFVAYLSLIHEARDIGRYVAVHPDTLDGTPCSTSPPAGSLWAHVCANAPSVIDATRIQDAPLVNPPCTTLNSTGHCALRTTSSQIHIRMAYDASSIIFLPSNFRLGPWLQVAIPTTLPPYDYFVMVEPH
jgi:hypothetical protein